MVALEAPRCREHGIRIQQDFPADVPLIKGDREKLKQVLVNLCTNAIDATPAGGTLTVRAYTEENQVAVEVMDSGSGVPDDVDIFEPFTTTKEKGTGLGLVIVRQIVSAHGRTLSYYSTPPQGTTFRLLFPA